MACIVKRNLSSSLLRYKRLSRAFNSSSILTSKKVPEEDIPKNLIQKYIGLHLQPNGFIYDKRPFKLLLKANKTYYWCSCGRSTTQPLCDGTHRIKNLKVQLRPVPFKVEETKEYWLCNCKQSEHKPFCDGTHKNEEIQSAIKHYKM